mmetsp:Transcript_5050/g.10826  ORF Transcript_5050/g.10826 Transcript_5050/m.10826 type:complete len:239 (-) Transcript_5050:107-823(-)
MRSPGMEARPSCATVLPSKTSRLKTPRSVSTRLEEILTWESFLRTFLGTCSVLSCSLLPLGRTFMLLPRSLAQRQSWAASPGARPTKVFGALLFDLRRSSCFSLEGRESTTVAVARLRRCAATTASSCTSETRLPCMTMTFSARSNSEPSPWWKACATMRAETCDHGAPLPLPLPPEPSSARARSCSVMASTCGRDGCAAYRRSTQCRTARASSSLPHASATLCIPERPKRSSSRSSG